MISINQLAKTLLLSLVIAAPVGLSIPGAQASSVTPHKQVAQATTTKKPKTKKKTQKRKSSQTTTTPSSKPSTSSTGNSSATPVPSPTKKP